MFCLTYSVIMDSYPIEGSGPPGGWRISLSRMAILPLVLILLGTSGATTGQWIIPLPHIPGTSLPSRVEVTGNSEGLALLTDRNGGPLTGQWQGWQPHENGFRALGLNLQVQVGDLPPTEMRLQHLSLERDPRNGFWNLMIDSLEMGHPHYRLNMSGLSWSWNERGYWQLTMGSLRLQVPVQTQLNQSRDPVWKMLELVVEAIAGQGNPAGWQGMIGPMEMTVPVFARGREETSPTHYGRGRIEPLQASVLSDGRFGIVNSGGFVDRSLANWLLGVDTGNDIRMGPLRIEGTETPNGLRIRARNLLPWLDLWYGEPGAAARHLKVSEIESGFYFEVGKFH